MTTKVVNDMLETPGTTTTSGTPITTNGAAAYEFTTVPAWAKKVTLLMRNVSVSGTSSGFFRIQLGTSGGYVVSGYTSTATAINSTAATSSALNNIGFTPAFAMTDAELYSGTIDFSEIDTNVWVMSSNLKASTNRMCFGSGDVSLGAELTSIKLEILSIGTFDGGTINVLYE